MDEATITQRCEEILKEMDTSPRRTNFCNGIYRAAYADGLEAARLKLCAYCRAGLPYKNGFHSGHPQSRDYYKACSADALVGDNVHQHAKEMGHE